MPTPTLFSRLEGTWSGRGSAFYPTIETFEYRETLTFTRRDDTSITYEQRTDKRAEDQETYVTSHWENGFLRLLPTGDVELINAQSGGRTEVLIGTVESFDGGLRLHLASKGLMNDERMIATTRTFEIHQDTLIYEMAMQTTHVNTLVQHLAATYHRVK